MKLKTRRFIATTFNGIIATAYVSAFVSIIGILLALPGLLALYMENDWWLLLLLVTLPLSVGIIGAIAEHIANED